jgi:DNA-binding MurR/RpiR family transcriptional regulator
VDFRRYQANLERLARTSVREGGARVVLVTDKWISPVASHASEILAVPIDNGTFWDSYAGALSVMEALMTRIAENDWDDARKRIETWDKVRLSLIGPENEDLGKKRPSPDDPKPLE